jgi:hypothetical protein
MELTFSSAVGANNVPKGLEKHWINNEVSLLFISEEKQEPSSTN